MELCAACNVCSMNRLSEVMVGGVVMLRPECSKLNKFALGEVKVNGGTEA